MTTPALVNSLIDQLEWHWTHQLRPRLAGLSDDEYFWAPVPDCWTVHPDGSIDFTYPPPEPTPVTTIAWRLAHVIVGVLAMRNHAHFDGPPADYQSWSYATDAETALAQLDDAHDRWVAGVRALTPAALDRPIGAAEGQWGDRPMIDLVLHIHREVIHHGAEISLLRDLYAHNKKES
ncbi:DinB family protein [Mycolicibacterium sp.]|uniref:DinB family protein n=1 Tax=Mycolicibacterium sp. TaxID=2320850 RepID=UPI003560CF75